MRPVRTPEVGETVTVMDAAGVIASGVTSRSGSVKEWEHIFGRAGVVTFAEGGTNKAGYTYGCVDFPATDARRATSCSVYWAWLEEDAVSSKELVDWIKKERTDV